MSAPGETPEVCRDCGGTGWVPSAADPTRVARCACRRQQSVDRLERDADLPPRYRSCTLQGFSTVHDGVDGRNQLVRAVSGDADPRAR